MCTFSRVFFSALIAHEYFPLFKLTRLICAVNLYVYTR